MAAPGSSPLPIRHSNDAPGTATFRRPAIEIHDDDDELGGDTIPCSPAAFLRDRGDRSSFVPTQLNSSPPPNFIRPLGSSSPQSIVEVPASSPFRPKPSLGSRLAPAGTIFRPPPKQPTPQPNSNQRPKPEPISLVSDDEDDLTPPRGDIRPTTFKAHISGFAFKPEQRDSNTKAKLKELYNILGPKFDSDVVERALKRNHGNVNDTVLWLQDGGPSAGRSSSSLKDQRPSAGSSRQSSFSQNDQRPSSKRSLSSISQAPKPPREVVRIPSSSPPRPAKRRLIKGLRKRSFTSPQKPVFEPAPPSSDDPLIIDLMDNDQGDAYEAERSPTPDDAYTNVLKCINESTLKELGAMTGLKEQTLEPMLQRRPFASLTQARRVSINKPSSRKPGKINIGDNVVDAISVYMNAVSAIDQVVAKCEKKAHAVKSVVDEWDMDTFGHRKRSPRGSPDKGDTQLPLTPISLGETKYKSLIIPQQPRLMDGHCIMKPFQLFGLNWMSVLYNYDIGCILADEMGLGKTCQVISFICSLVEKHEEESQQERPWPNLIVVPPSTYNNWLAEFERFAPDLSVMGYRGSQAERADIAYEVQQNPDDYHVVLATYSQINSEADVEAMQSFDLNAAIFDEGHKMKNPETKVYKDLMRIPASWKLLLTGTPVQNNLLEMTSLLNFINPKMFDGYMEHIKFIFSHKVTVRDVTNGAFLYSERVKRARTILEPFILQRRKDQVLSDMPRKTNTVVRCDLTEAQKPTYDDLEELFRAEPSIRAQRPTKGRQNDVNNVWMQLRKAALHPLLFRLHFTDKATAEMGKILMDRIDQSELHQPDLKHLVQELRNSSDFELHLWCRDYPKLLSRFDLPQEAELNSGKVKKLLELVNQYQENGDRVLVFSKFSRLIELLQEVMAVQGIDHRVLTGSTNVSDRQDLIDEFNDNPDIPVFLLTTGAGGTGINLTAANKVIIFDQSDNPQDDIQAENRAHRLGQKRDVEIVRLISRNTVEELIYEACKKKIELANKVTGAVGEDAQDEAEHAGNLEKEVRRMLGGTQKGSDAKDA